MAIPAGTIPGSRILVLKREIHFFFLSFFFVGVGGYRPKIMQTFIFGLPLVTEKAWSTISTSILADDGNGGW
jgi:hypothetical protein